MENQTPEKNKVFSLVFESTLLYLQVQHILIQVFYNNLFLFLMLIVRLFFPLKIFTPPQGHVSRAVLSY